MLLNHELFPQKCCISASGTGLKGQFGEWKLSRKIWVFSALPKVESILVTHQTLILGMHVIALTQDVLNTSYNVKLTLPMFANNNVCL